MIYYSATGDFIIMLEYSLGKNKTSETPNSGAGEIHKSSAQKQEGRNDAYSTRAHLSYNLELFHYPRI